MSYNYIKLPISIDSVPQVALDSYAAAIESPKLYTGVVNVMFVSYDVEQPGLSGLWNIKVRDTFGTIKFETANFSLSTSGAGELSAIGEFNLEESDQVIFDTSAIAANDTYTVTLSDIKYNYDIQYVPTPTPTPTITPTPANTTGEADKTLTTAPLTAGGMEIVMSSTEQLKFPVGTNIIIAPDLPTVEYNQVVAHGSLILNTPLKYNHPTGTTIVIGTSGAAFTPPTITKPITGIPGTFTVASEVRTGPSSWTAVTGTFQAGDSNVDQLKLGNFTGNTVPTTSTQSATYKAGNFTDLRNVIVYDARGTVVPPNRYILKAVDMMVSGSMWTAVVLDVLLPPIFSGTFTPVALTPTPTPTPTESYMGSCSASDPLSAIGCNNSINWTLSSDDEIQFFEIYRACSATEHYLPLSAYELIDVVYDPTARQYVDWYQPGCRICRYLIAAGNPRMTMMVPYVSAVGCVGPTCTPTPTPTYPCFDYDFDIGDPDGVRYVRVLSEEFTQAVKYVKCTSIDDERYLPIIPPTPPVNPVRPYCLTPTPTPTFLAQEFDMCFPTPTPTPTPTVISDEFEFITPTPSPTPTPTPTAPYDGILVDGSEACLSFIESRFNDNDYITVWVKSLTKPPHERFEILCKKLLIPHPGLTYCVPMDLDEEMEVTIFAESEGIYPPCTIDVAYDSSVVYKDIFLKEREIFKFNMLRRS